MGGKSQRPSEGRGSTVAHEPSTRSLEFLRRAVRDRREPPQARSFDKLRTNGFPACRDNRTHAYGVQPAALSPSAPAAGQPSAAPRPSGASGVTHVVRDGSARGLRMSARVPSAHPWNFLGVEGVPPRTPPPLRRCSGQAPRAAALSGLTCRPLRTTKAKWCFKSPTALGGPMTQPSG